MNLSGPVKLPTKRSKKTMNTNLTIRTLIGLVLITSVAIAQQGRSKVATERFDTDDVKTISGTITTVNHPIAILKGEDGKEYSVHMGPYWFWEREEYSLKKGEKTQVKGEIEDVKGTMHLYPWQIVQDGKTMKLADDDGVPEWSGNKNGRGRGHGVGIGKHGRGGFARGCCGCGRHCW
jgi:hypothetical protein